ncbi:PLP-dependent aminotransferase family protein [Streptomyces sp. NPDC101455]|uniref:aminotransferase-like domain-containing protein n=1 Tax=Streptomyces sp. NPDC101455 TaxID=3366142 RepID=UPI003813B99D
MINLGRGMPSADLIDTIGLAQAVQGVLARDAGTTLGYGSPAGYQPLREWVAARHGVDPCCVMITPGAMQAVLLATEVLVGCGAGGEVLVDLPTYDMVLQALTSRGLTVRRFDAAGERDAAGAGRRCVYTVPTFRNPDGVTVALPERQVLLERATSAGAVVIEDDPYRELRFAGAGLPSLWELSGSDRVVHVSSFSKTVCPGLRVGYVIADERLIESLTAAANRMYITPSMFAQAIAHQYVVEGGLDGPLERMRAKLAARADLLCELLDEELPQAGFERPQGGYFVWLRLSGTMRASDLASAAQRHGVAVAPGGGFFLDGGERYVRLCFAAEPPDRIAEGVRRLAAAAAAASGAGRTSQEAAGRPQLGEEPVLAHPA